MQRAMPSADRPPSVCAITKGATSAIRIPVNVSDNERATVIAGFAKEVDEVNQYAAPIHAATSRATLLFPMTQDYQHQPTRRDKFRQPL